MAKVTFANVQMVVSSLQSFPGSGIDRRSLTSRIGNNAGLVIPSGLMQGGSSAFLRYINLRATTDPSASGRSNLRAETVDSGTGTSAGPRLSPEWEANPLAITVETGGRSYTSTGPNVAGNRVRDTSEPYSWAESIAKSRELITYLASISGTTGTRTLTFSITLDDGESTRVFKGGVEYTRVFKGGVEYNQFFKGSTPYQGTI